MLTQKVESKRSEFDISGAADRNGAVYEIKHKGGHEDIAHYNVGDFIVLVGGTYDQLPIDGVVYIAVKPHHIVAVLKPE